MDRQIYQEKGFFSIHRCWGVLSDFCCWKILQDGHSDVWRPRCQFPGGPNCKRHNLCFVRILLHGCQFRLWTKAGKSCVWEKKGNQDVEGKFFLHAEWLKKGNKPCGAIRCDLSLSTRGVFPIALRTDRWIDGPTDRPTVGQTFL